MNSISPNLNIMIKAAEKASKILIRDFGELEKLQVSSKGPSDFVTSSDKKVEKIIIEELTKSKKKFSILSEEIGEVKNLDKNNHNLRGKWGFFYEYSTNDLNRIKNYINNKYQTLTYFGMDKDSLKNFVINNQLQGIDRIVPVGQALDISFFWDGYDLNRILSRVVDIK